jgi:DNA-binding transcriptional ArsR family regulator
MPSKSKIPDYDLAEKEIITAPAQLRAIADPLRDTILDLLLERAATVGELAAAAKRPKSTVAHHVNVLVDAGMLRVVRTRRVRAIDERYYGRTARVFMVGVVNKPGEDPTTVHANALSVAATESGPAHEADTLSSILRHAKVPRPLAREFWDRVLVMAGEFAQLPRTGDTVYAFAAGLYPTDYPTLPEPKEEITGPSAKKRRPAPPKRKARRSGSAEASGDPPIGQVEVLLPGLAVVVDLPGTFDRGAVVGEAARVALGEVQR